MLNLKRKYKVATFLLLLSLISAFYLKNFVIDTNFEGTYFCASTGEIIVYLPSHPTQFYLYQDDKQIEGSVFKKTRRTYLLKSTMGEENISLHRNSFILDDKGLTFNRVSKELVLPPFLTMKGE